METSNGYYELMACTATALAAVQGYIALQKRSTAPPPPTTTSSDTSTAAEELQRQAGNSLTWRYLSVFLVYKLGDWMQGPYFYEVYSEKAGGDSSAITRIFLTGFVAAMAGGAFAGGVIDTRGRRFATVAACACFALSACSTTSGAMPVLLAGRVLGGIATSLFSTAPEAWMLTECTRLSLPGSFRGALFGWIYFCDALVAILAGYTAEAAATATGRSTGPFELSGIAAIASAALALLLWEENTGETASAPAGGAGKESPAVSPDASSGGGKVSALSAIFASPSILALGAAQASFEGCMYVFVLMWGQALTRLAPEGSEGGKVPFGLVFSCFMMACMVGSSVAGHLMERGVSQRAVLAGGFLAGAAGVAVASVSQGPTAAAAGFCLYEMAVGVYFPCMGALRASILEDSTRASITNYLRVPMNLTVIAGMFVYDHVGCTGGHYIVICGCLVSLASLLAVSQEKPKVE